MIDFLGNWLGLVSTNVNTAEERKEFKSSLVMVMHYICLD